MWIPFNLRAFARKRNPLCDFNHFHTRKITNCPCWRHWDHPLSILLHKSFGQEHYSCWFCSRQWKWQPCVFCEFLGPRVVAWYVNKENSFRKAGTYSVESGIICSNTTKNYIICISNIMWIFWLWSCMLWQNMQRAHPRIGSSTGHYQFCLC